MGPADSARMALCCFRVCCHGRPIWPAEALDKGVCGVCVWQAGRLVGLQRLSTKVRAGVRQAGKVATGVVVGLQS